MKEVGKTLGSLGELRSEIIKRFGEEVNVNLNSIPGHRTLSITFVNSQLNDKSSDERNERAQQTVDIVKSHYPDIKSVDQIFVMFSKVATALGIFHSSSVIDQIAFDKEGKPIQGVITSAPFAPDTDEEAELKPRVTYSPTQNQTEIYLDGIQLEGVAGNGLTMVPRLTVTGNTNKETPSAPAFIRFDFASFAEKPMFPGLTDISLVGDQISYRTKGQFSTSRSNDGLASEFLYLNVPYSMFQQMIAGKVLTVKLSERKYQLTREQFHALQRMTQYVKKP